jgi:uncharacterized DUF497 family protein
MPWKITFDPAKRDWTLRERGLDFLEASLVFDGTTIRTTVVTMASYA